MPLDLYEISSRLREELRHLSAILVCKNCEDLVGFESYQIALGGA
jgi:hypothetical protein